MLEKPDLQDADIGTCLYVTYGVSVTGVTFLPLGADFNTAVYRIVADESECYFLKLRRGDFDETSVALPGLLSDLDIAQIIPPLTTKNGQLFGYLSTFKTILYPYVDGHNGYEIALTEDHWDELGTALKRIHTADVPPALTSRIRRERYSPHHRDAVMKYLSRVQHESFADPTASQLAVYLAGRRPVIEELIRRAAQLAQVLQAQSPAPVVCHSDIHAGNVLIASTGALYIVDWDEPILAPKERDLMYIGGGLLASGLAPEEEERLFYRSYGDERINRAALAYYRYERIVQDIAAYCEQLLLTDEGGADREQSLHYLKSNFQPGGTIEIAHRTDRTQPASWRTL